MKYKQNYLNLVFFALTASLLSACPKGNGEPYDLNPQIKDLPRGVYKLIDRGATRCQDGSLNPNYKSSLLLDDEGRLTKISEDCASRAEEVQEAIGVSTAFRYILYRDSIYQYEPEENSSALSQAELYCTGPGDVEFTALLNFSLGSQSEDLENPSPCNNDLPKRDLQIQIGEGLPVELTVERDRTFKQILYQSADVEATISVNRQQATGTFNYEGKNYSLTSCVVHQDSTQGYCPPPIYHSTPGDSTSIK